MIDSQTAPGAITSVIVPIMALFERGFPQYGRHLVDRDATMETI